MLKRTLYTLAMVLIVAAVGWGTCHASNTRKLQQSTDIPRCIPGMTCPAR